MGNTIAFTVVTNERGPATKQFTLKPDGTLEKRPGGQIFEGKAQRGEITDLPAFIAFRASLAANQALTYGVTEAPSARIVSQRDLAKAPGAIARDAEHFAFAKGEPGVFMGDYDPKPGARPLSAEELDRILIEVMPELAGVARAWAPSSSAFIFGTDGRELIGAGGWRLYLIVDDASRIPDIGARLYQALWAAGHGYIVISKAGSMLDRSLLDASVWQAERLDFGAAPILGPGLERRAPAPLIIPGAPMLLTASLAPVTPLSEWRKTSAQLREARNQKKPEADATRKKFVKERVAEARRIGVPAKLAARVYEDAIIYRTLRADFRLVAEDGSTVTVRELLDARGRWNGVRFHDPLEPDYRGDARIAYVSLGHDPYLFSHAHGGIRYSLASQSDTVKVIKGELHRAVDETIEIVRQRKDLYDRGGELVRVVGGKIIQMDEAGLAHYLGRAVKYLKPYIVEGEIEWRPFDPPAALVKQVLSKRAEMGLQRLERVISAPALRSDGSIICKSGYDAATGLLLVDGVYPSILQNPTEGQLERAWERLWRPFSEFPYASRFDRGVMVAAILTTLTRHLCPTAPAFSFEAPAAGSGKTKLGMCLQILAGMEPSATPPPPDETEMSKLVPAFLSGSEAVLLIDNVRGELVSATLETLLTAAGKFTPRQFGTNKVVLPLPSQITVLLSGNNMSLGGDLFRRALRCRIDAKTDRPECRSFALEPVKYCIEHRQALVVAGLTLMRGFIAAGRPRDPYAGGRLGSFDQWDDLVRQCVLWLNREGIADLGDSIHCIEATKASDPGRQLLAAFLHAAWEWRGSDSWTVKDAIMFADHGSDLHDAMTDIAGDRHVFKSVNARKLGKWIAAHRGTRSGGLYLDQREQSENTKVAARWFICSERGGRANADAGQSDHSGRFH